MTDEQATAGAFYATETQHDDATSERRIEEDIALIESMGFVLVYECPLADCGVIRV